MVVYRIYYQMVDRASKNVSGIWKVLHIWTQVMAAGTGIVSVWFFHTILQAFSYNCPLFAKVEFTLLQPGSVGLNILPNNITVNVRESTWGKNVYCQYTFTTWMTSFIGGLIILTFFVWSKSGGGGGPRDSFVQPWRHVLPTLLVSICYVVNTSVAAYFASGGLDVFCEGFAPYTKSYTYSISSKGMVPKVVPTVYCFYVHGHSRCNYKIDLFSLPFANSILKVNQAIIMVRSCAPICVISWICHTAILFLRICIAPDFDVQIIKITGIKRTERHHEDEPPEKKTEDSIFQGHKESSPSLHELFSRQPSRLTSVRFFTPELQSESSDERTKNAHGSPLTEKKSGILMPRPSDYGNYKSDEVRMLTERVISVDSDIQLDPRTRFPKHPKPTAGKEAGKKHVTASDLEGAFPDHTTKHAWFSPEGFLPSKTSAHDINQEKSDDLKGSSPDNTGHLRRTTSVLKKSSEPPLEELPESPPVELEPKPPSPPPAKDKEETFNEKSSSSDQRDIESAPSQQTAARVYSKVFLERNKEESKAPKEKKENKK